MDPPYEDDEDRSPHRPPNILPNVTNGDGSANYDDDDTEVIPDDSSSTTVKEISAPYDTPHYPIEVEQQLKILLPQMEQFAHKEFEEREKALPSKDHFVDGAISCEVSAPNSGVVSSCHLDTGNAGLATPVTAREYIGVNGAFDCGMRSPDLNDEIDYIPHFHRVYISGAEKSGVSMVGKQNEYFADSSLLRVSFYLGGKRIRC